MKLTAYNSIKSTDECISNVVIILYNAENFHKAYFTDSHSQSQNIPTFLITETLGGSRLNLNIQCMLKIHIRYRFCRNVLLTLKNSFHLQLCKLSVCHSHKFLSAVYLLNPFLTYKE